MPILKVVKWVLGGLFLLLSLYLIFFMCYMYFDLLNTGKFIDIQSTPLLLWPQFGLMLSFGIIGIGLLCSKRWTVIAYWISIVYWIAVSFIGNTGADVGNILSLLLTAVPIIATGILLQQFVRKGILR
jgi:hypothetical protein